jgi:hypothetical protein
VGESARHADSPPNAPRITRLGVQGFKSIYRDSTIGIGKLTLLAGANSSGKSSHLQPLLLMKQTLEAAYDPGALLLEGPNVSITSADQVLSRSGSKGPDAVTEFSAELVFDGGRSVRMTFGREEPGGLGIRTMVVHRPGHTVRYMEGARPDAAELSPAMKQLGDALMRGSEPGGDRLEVDWDWRVVRYRCFLVPAIIHGGDIVARALTPDFAELPTHQVESVIHVPGLRGNPERTYRTTAIGDTFPGTFDPYVASLVMAWQQQADERFRAVARDLRALGLTGKIEARPVDDTRVELRVGRALQSAADDPNDLVSVADVGFGVSQTLPVVVALNAARPGQVVYIEQPEIHLHPRAQTRLAGLLVDAVDRGVIVVVETHSSLLLRGIQTAVARSLLDPDDVALHWFSRRADGTTEVTTAELADDGSFGDWPTDFDDIALESDRAYLDAAEERLAGG